MGLYLGWWWRECLLSERSLRLRYFGVIFGTGGWRGGGDFYSRLYSAAYDMSAIFNNVKKPKVTLLPAMQT